MQKLLIVLAACLLSACAHRPSYDPADPLEPINRGIYAFNTTADKYVLKPIAKGYVAVMPDAARTGINNFFDNLFYPITIVNQYLQGKFADGSADLGRFLINSTVGIGGIFDVAQHWGLPQHQEDFGQTFGTWGVGEGWYLMLPFLGPSTNRDFVGRLTGAPLSPLYYVDEKEVVWGATALDTIQTRAQLLKADGLLAEQIDPYVFIRSAYLQQRWSAVHDGAPPAEDDGFDELDEFNENF